MVSKKEKVISIRISIKWNSHDLSIHCSVVYNSRLPDQNQKKLFVAHHKGYLLMEKRKILSFNNHMDLALSSDE